MKTINERDADMIESIEMWLHEIEPKWVEKELTWLGDFRTRLAEEPVSDCHDLEEEAEEWAENEAYGKPDAEFEMAYKGFKAGAEWQKAKMMKDNLVIMSVEDFQALIDSHAKRVEADYKEKMLKEAVRGEVYKFGEIAYVKERNNAELTKYLSQFNNGDKVKIIVVHETDIR